MRIHAGDEHNYWISKGRMGQAIHLQPKFPTRNIRIVAIQRDRQGCPLHLRHNALYPTLLHALALFLPLCSARLLCHRANITHTESMLRKQKLAAVAATGHSRVKTELQESLSAEPGALVIHTQIEDG
jgi:hypothetical protein